MLRFVSLGSGSRGNATLIQSATTRILLDCGFPARELELRLQTLGMSGGDLDAIVVTHEHGDHVRGVGPAARRFKVPVWMTHGTRRGSKCGDIPDLHLFSAHGESLSIGDITLIPCAVPHDAREPSQFVFECDGKRLGILTDLGSLTPRLVDHLQALDALLLECNHDVAMLKSGPYPPGLQARVGGDYGHLSNTQAASILRSIDTDRIGHLVLGHLSEKNNLPELAIAAIAAVSSDLANRLSVLKQDTVSQWFVVE